MEIKAIETEYKGYRFRSRLEARWAVFFDALEIGWVYEPEGFVLPSGCYLPDFWLPQVSMFAEVKPKAFTAEELTFCLQLFEVTKREVLLLDGIPSGRLYPAINGYEFKHGRWDVSVTTHDIQDGNHYWKSENRFFSYDEHWLQAGGDFCRLKFEPTEDIGYKELLNHCIKEYLYEGDERAIGAARSVRFEHRTKKR